MTDDLGLAAVSLGGSCRRVLRFSLPARRPCSAVPPSFHCVLYVADQHRSTAFYEAVLGMPLRLHVLGMTEFELPGGGVPGLVPEHGIVRLLAGTAPPDPARAR